MTERAAIQDKVPEFFRTMWTGTMDAVSKVEQDFEGFVEKMVERGKLTEEEGKKVLNNLIDRFAETRTRIEKRAGEGLEQTWIRFNLPTKSEVNGLDKRVAKLKRQVNKLKKEVETAS